MCGTVCEQFFKSHLKSYYFFTIPQYMNNNSKDLRITDIKQTISKSYKSIELFQKLIRF